MPQAPDILPYRGSLTAPSAGAVGWAITVVSWPTARPLFHLSAGEVFDAQVLVAHLVLAGFVSPRVRLAERTCRVVFLPAPASPKDPAVRIMRILKAHYSHYKGRPIEWTRV